MVQYLFQLSILFPEILCQVESYSACFEIDSWQFHQWYSWMSYLSWNCFKGNLHLKSRLSMFLHYPRKFKGGICCGGHLAVTYGGELLYIRIFSQLSPPSNFVKRELPFSRGLWSLMHSGESRDNDNVRRSRRMIIVPNPKVQ